MRGMRATTTVNQIKIRGPLSRIVVIVRSVMGEAVSASRAETAAAAAADASEDVQERANGWARKQHCRQNN